MNSTTKVVTFFLFTIIVTFAQVKSRSVTYQPIDCSEAKVPCSGLNSETCSKHCSGIGFAHSACDGDCCLCYPDGLQPEEITSQNYAIKNTNLIEASDHSSSTDSIISSSTASSTNNEVCLTPACVKTAAELLDNMNLNADPCDNFYEFTCGGFVNRTTIPEDKPEITPIISITDKLKEQIRILVEEPINSDEPKPFSLLKMLYKSCLDLFAIEVSGLQPLLDMLKKLGGWPVLEGMKWNFVNWTWIQSIFNFRQLGYSTDYFMRFSIIPDLKNSTRNIITIDEPALSIAREQFLQEQFLRVYHKYQVDLSVLLGAEQAVAEKEMRDVLEFERRLANISTPREQRRDSSKFYNPMTISELQSKFPSVPWLTYMENMLPTTVKVGMDDLVILASPNHLTKFLQLIEETDTRVQANYIMWRAAAASVRYMNREARDLEFNFASTITGQRQQPPRWKECVGMVSSSLPHAVGALYVRRHFKEEARVAAMEMVGDIRIAFLEILADVEWMDAQTKKLAWKKATSMTSHIGYPKELLEDEKLTEFYKDLELTDNGYLRNVLSLTVSGTNYGMNKLNKINDKTDWRAYGKPAVVNAFYSPLQNSIQFPAGILQGNFFGNERPRYMNYGSIGWVIGHEITHGFDDQGRMFNSNGDHQEWWDPITRESYLKKAQCMVQQYGQYTYTDVVRKHTLPLNGFVSQGENIADNGGIKQAYKGYQSWVLRNGPEKKLPGLDYTPDQLFWISAANNWCSKHRPEAMIHNILTGIHLPGEFRVRGTFANMEQFAKDFNCPLSSNMNPVNKCAVW